MNHYHENGNLNPACPKWILANTNVPVTEAEKVDVSTPDPNVGSGRISAVAAELMDTLIKKNSDYAPTTEFSNFEESAKFADIEPFELMLAQIGIKYSRVYKLNGTILDPSFESLRDSLVDLAGYAVIAAAWLDAVQEDQADGEHEECEYCG